jgi:acyl-CoA synthetase (AMP-forming)/AMP-acid ligase II
MPGSLSWFRQRLERHRTTTAAVWHDTEVSYGELLDRVDNWRQRLADRGLSTGDVCAIIGDDSIDACAVLLAALFDEMIAVPLCSLSPDRYPYCIDTSQARAVIDCRAAAADVTLHTARTAAASHPLFDALRSQPAPGLVLFSSGSSGEPKAVLWDAQRLVARHREVRRAYRTLVFLRLDHIGGINTLFHVLCGGQTLVVSNRRDVEGVCQAIEHQRIELLPTTPTFLKMLLLSGAAERFDLTSLGKITYGTETIHPGVLQALAAALPGVDFKQTYGLSELGILATQSRQRDSVWVKLGGDGVETRVVEGQLWIRTTTAMLGYLNHPSPFDAEGWFNTRDAVEIEGEYVRILGRTSDIINVAGEKVYPAEVEDVLLAAGNVREAAVCGRSNPITGQVVTARVALVDPEPQHVAQHRLITFCRGRLAPFQVPMLIEFTSDGLHTERGKTVRRIDGIAA